MRARGIVVVVACVGVAACALFPAVDGLVGDGGGALDATSDAVSDVSAEASSDSGPSDVVQASDADAGTDADTGTGADADADAATSFCATHLGHTFCEDFDEPNFASRWTTLSLSSGATLDESDASSQSPPNQLLGDVTFPAQTSASTAYAGKHFASASTITAEAELEVTSTLAKIDPIQIHFSPAPAGYDYYEIHIDTGDDHLGASWVPSDGGPSSYVDVTFPNNLAAWHDVKLVVDVKTSAVQAYLDGTLVAQTAIPALSAAAFDLRVGVVTGSNSSTSALDGTVHVDNVLVDTVP